MRAAGRRAPACRSILRQDGSTLEPAFAAAADAMRSEQPGIAPPANRGLTDTEQLGGFPGSYVVGHPSYLSHVMDLRV